MIKSSPQYFASHATDLRTALATIRDTSGLLARLLEGGHSVIAGRQAGAFRNSGPGTLMVGWTPDIFIEMDCQ